MIGIFALLGHYSTKVLVGGILGGVLATLNFFFMAVCASLAADKAEAQNVKGGEGLIRISYFVRMIVIFLVLFALIRSNLCNPLAAVLPLAFTRPIITIGEFFRKSGEK
jgi:F0F1-type ATP synthase assembly protein I